MGYCLDGGQREKKVERKEHEKKGVGWRDRWMTEKEEKKEGKMNG